MPEAPLTIEPRIIQVHPDDNVAIVVNANGLKAGSRLPSGLVLREDVPRGHKIALRGLAEGEEIRRYNTVIGTATASIPCGSWVSETRIHMPKPPPLEHLPLATQTPPPGEKLEGYTFEGYRNPDGSIGVRNLLAIATSVQCVQGVVEYAVKRIEQELLPRFPNVDGVVGLTHTYGCGVAITAPGAMIPIRTLRNITRNPNLCSAPMVVGLGCEKLAPEWLLSDGQPGAAAGNTPDIVRLQDESHDGFAAMLASIMQRAELRLAQLNQRSRTTCPASELVVGTQCGGSDAFSGVTANPAVGVAADLLVRAGATVMFSEVTEVRDAIHLLTPRAVDENVGRALVREMAWYDDYLAQGAADRSANTTPGNKRGGLANIVEKALGSVAKSGSSAIAGVVPPGERAACKGLLFAATPASDFICGTLQLAAGMHLQVFTTGRGTPYGLTAAPVIKMATNDSLAERWHDLMDISAGRIATGAASIEEVGWDLFHLILDVASGRKTWSERWGIANALALFNPGPVT